MIGVKWVNPGILTIRIDITIIRLQCHFYQSWTLPIMVTPLLITNGWWKWDCEILWEVKVMFELIITNNIQCGYICDCETVTKVKHIWFQCPNVENICRILLHDVMRKNPGPMIDEFNNRTARKKIICTAVSMGSLWASG